MLDVIKDYLVSIGFSVNTNTLNQAKQAMDKMDNVVKKFASGATVQFAVAGTAVATFVFAANIAIGEFLTKLAKADLQMEMLARQMWTSKENAAAFKNSLDAMGASMQDLYLSPELLKNFMALRQQSFQMVPPAEYADQMKGIRSIMFEFQRFKLEATYALQWVGYYLIKYIEKPLAQLKLSFKSFNDELVKSMPSWTKNIAQVLSWIVRLGLAAWEIRKAILGIGAAFMGFKLINLLTSPIGLMIAGMLALLILIDDYNTYMTKDAKGNHGESLFGDFWKKLDESGALKNIEEAFSNISKAINNILEAFNKLMTKFAGAKWLSDFGDMLENRVVKVLQGLADLLNAIADLLEGRFKKSWDNLGSGATNLFENGQSVDWGKYFGDILKANKDAVTNPKQYVQDLLDQFNMDWMKPAVNSSSATSGNVTQNFNVYGNDPNATASAVQRQANDGLLTRSLQGAR